GWSTSGMMLPRASRSVYWPILLPSGHTYSNLAWVIVVTSGTVSAGTPCLAEPRRPPRTCRSIPQYVWDLPADGVPLAARQCRRRNEHASDGGVVESGRARENGKAGALLPLRPRRLSSAGPAQAPI